MKALFSVIALAIVGSAMADKCTCAHCGTGDKFTMTAMGMATKAAPIAGDPWGTDCKMACCKMDMKGHHGKMMKKKSKRSHRAHR